MTQHAVTIRLPWPPSVNRYWRRHQGRVLISRDGRRYRKDVEALVAGECVREMHGRLSVSIHAVVPDRRNRDLDNLLKSSLDAMEHAGVFRDDGQIDDLRIFRGGSREARMDRRENRRTGERIEGGTHA